MQRGGLCGIDFASSQMIAITVKQHNNQPRLQYVHTKVVVVEVEVMGMIILSLSVFGGGGGMYKEERWYMVVVKLFLTII